MIDKASVHAERIAKYEFDHGRDEVEHFLDAVLSIQEHVDYNLYFVNRTMRKTKRKRNQKRNPLVTMKICGLGTKEKKAQEERDQRPGNLQNSREA